MTNDAGWYLLGLALGLGGVLGYLAGYWRASGPYERPGGLMDQAYDEGRDDERSEAHDMGPETRQLLPAEWRGERAADGRSGSALHPQDPQGGSQQLGSVARGEPGQEPANDFLHPDWEQLAPDRIDLPSPMPSEAAPSEEPRAGELNRRVVDLGQPGDNKMLTRDWFNRRDWIDSLYDPRWGGFELTDSGHLAAVAA